MTDAASARRGVTVRALGAERSRGRFSAPRCRWSWNRARRRSYHLDPTRAESRLARRTVDDLLQRAAGRMDAFAAREAPIEAIGSRYIDWLLPGLLGMNIMSTGLWGLGFSIVQARTRKLLKRLIASPMRRRDYLLAQLFGRLVFLGIEVGALLLFGYFAFGVPMRGSMTCSWARCLVGAVAFGGLGLLVASRARTIEAVSGLLNLVMLPMWVLSGVFFSASNFPAGDAALHPGVAPDRPQRRASRRDARRRGPRGGRARTGSSRRMGACQLWRRSPNLSLALGHEVE